MLFHKLPILLIALTAAAQAQTVQLDPLGYQNVQNLKQLALAMHNYESANNTFPAPYLQSAGSPALSWRVALLPYLGLDDLYNQFNFSKPWDDPSNLPLLQQMPAVFRSPADSAGSASTHYLVPTGPNLIFNGPTGTQFSAITDGTSNTLLIGESAAAVPWTAPQDLAIPPNPTLASAGFSSITPGYAPFAFADGSVRFLRSDIDSQTLQDLFQLNDGAVIPSSATLDYVLAVPEPGSLALFGVIVLPLAALRRRGPEQMS